MFSWGGSKSFFLFKRAGQNKKMTEEEAENAEVRFGKNWMVLAVRETWKKRVAILLARGASSF
jgi:hypothetical protein